MASNAIVIARDVLNALSELRRVGTTAALDELEQVEPDLAGHLMEELRLIHKALLDLHAKPNRTRRLVRQIESLAIVLVLALRNAHARLWQDQEAVSAASPVEPSRTALPPQARDRPPFHIVPAVIAGEGDATDTEHCALVQCLTVI